MTKRKKTESSAQDKHLHSWVHWGVLLFGILLAVLVWAWWLSSGMDLARNMIAKSFLPHVTLSSGKDSTIQHTALREQLYTELGQTGDAFGALNALLTSIAGALVAWAGFLQFSALSLARTESSDERRHRDHQKFESLFFQLLSLSADATEKLKHSEAPNLYAVKPDTVATIYMGESALSRWAHSVFYYFQSHTFNSAEILLEALVVEYAKIYTGHAATLGPYYRLLYQTFRAVDDAKIDIETKIRFANIARGQMSGHAVFLLALNGLTPDGNKFVPLIERYGLLEHLQPDFKRRLMHAMRLGYREPAFCGSEQRKVDYSAILPTSKLSAGHYAAIIRHPEKVFVSNVNLHYNPEDIKYKDD